MHAQARQADIPLRVFVNAADRSGPRGAGLAGVGTTGPSAGRAAEGRQARCLLAIGTHAAWRAGRWSEMTASVQVFGPGAMSDLSP